MGNTTKSPQALVAVYDGYLEIANIKKGEILSFSPITRKNLVKIANLSIINKSAAVVKGIIPKSVEFITFSLERVIILFREPAKNRKILLEREEFLMIDVPNLLMLFDNDKFKVYCYKSRLTSKTKLYAAPFSNSGGVTGNVVS